MNTIFALSTVFGKSGIAIFRISGNNAYKVVQYLKITKIVPPRKAIFTKFYNETNELIDEGMIIYFPEPKSFTGEELIELHTHGSIAVINEMHIYLSKYFNIAQRGEFSKRAFINGKFDLTAAEGITDLINAETASQRRQALKQISGVSKNLYESWRKDIVSTMAIMEAFIDFPDEDISPNLMEEIKTKIVNLKQNITSYLSDNRRGQKVREGIKITIIGPPNAGKSSLFNYMSDRNVAIVSSIPGTTRDIIESNMNIEGLLVTLQDTAGIHETIDEIEQEGINRANSAIDSADLILLLIPHQCIANNTKEARNFLFAFQDKIKAHHDILYIASKCETIEENIYFEEKKFFTISINENKGLNELRSNICAFLKQYNIDCESPIITEERHRAALSSAREALEVFLNFESTLEILAEHLRIAASYIGSITGKVQVEEVLDELFSKLCIGK